MSLSTLVFNNEQLNSLEGWKTIKTIPGRIPRQWGSTGSQCECSDKIYYNYIFRQFRRNKKKQPLQWMYTQFSTAVPLGTSSNDFMKKTKKLQRKVNKKLHLRIIKTTIHLRFMIHCVRFIGMTVSRDIRRIKNDINDTLAMTISLWSWGRWKHSFGRLFGARFLIVVANFTFK